MTEQPEPATSPGPKDVRDLRLMTVFVGLWFAGLMLLRIADLTITVGLSAVAVVSGFYLYRAGRRRTADDVPLFPRSRMLAAWAGLVVSLVLVLVLTHLTSRTADDVWFWVLAAVVVALPVTAGGWWATRGPSRRGAASRVR